MNKLKTIIVMPSYNSEATFKKTILDIPFDYVDEIVFVDDASKGIFKLIANFVKSILIIMKYKKANSFSWMRKKK